MTIERITHRRDPIYHTTYTGRPPDEPAILGLALNDVFVPILQTQFPEIVDFYLPSEACSYRVAVVSIRKEYPGHAKRVMFGVWSYLRQFMYTKIVIVVDADIDARKWADVIWAISTRVDPKRDSVLVESTPIDYLDFASPVAGLGSKLGIDATTKWPGEVDRQWGRPIYHARRRRREGRRGCGASSASGSPIAWTFVISLAKLRASRALPITTIRTESPCDTFSSPTRRAGAARARSPRASRLTLPPKVMRPRWPISTRKARRFRGSSSAPPTTRRSPPCAGFESGLKSVPRNTEYVIIDSPAGSYGKDLTELVRKAETIVVPVLPSPIDIKAAERFVEELLSISKVADKKAKAALVANRVKENTLIFEELDGVLSRLKVPYVAQRSAKRRTTTAPISAASASMSCRRTSLGPIGSSGIR